MSENERVATELERQQILQAIVDNYDRRRRHWWGRLLLWLLRKTT